MYWGFLFNPLYFLKQSRTAKFPPIMKLLAVFRVPGDPGDGMSCLKADRHNGVQVKKMDLQGYQFHKDNTPANILSHS